MVKADSCRLALPMTTSPPANPIGNIFIKSVLATFVALTLLIFLWNLQPYYDTLLLSPTTYCSSSATSISLPIKSKTTIDLNPNKRTFQAYGSAAALFVQMGAYRGGPTTFAVVGLASKPIHVFDRPSYKCEWIPNNSSNSSIQGKTYKILPDWGYGRVYTVVVVNCTFDANPNADNSGGKLMIYAYYGASSSDDKYEKFTALEETPGSYDDSNYRPPYKYEYLYCGSSLYGNLNAARMREWMAYHAWFFGSNSHFVFHDAGGVSPEVRAVLEPWIKAGRVTLQDIRGQAEYDGYYYNQFLVVNDCLHRYRHAANWTFYFDVDEYIYIPDGNASLESVLKDMSNYTQFTIEQNAMSSMLCMNDSTQHYSREWGFEKLVFRDSRRKVRRDRKYAIQAKNAYATGVHMSENVIGASLHNTHAKIRYYHYHNSITVHQELCRNFLPHSAMNATIWLDKISYVYDDNLKRLAPTIKLFDANAVGLGN
ncbi:hypothetical protein BUALT_Bualt15G0138400 [Buddleja alternifolia]|uniref:Glycosyltransferase family 92 protein n=1 Tax=Buddleja alternifolia TaxID=168488 RepID=A0AAV6WEZ6_9LAMI|nr:hypothetical protein BUALT_Bualt15G0138400 [Buddleja alternifolia]